jgi:DedD protein
MSEIDERSYYEVALTNRQVLMAFIVILSAVLGSFLCGVWVGRGGRGPLEAQEIRAAGGSAAEGGEELESFRFFADPDAEEEEPQEEKAEPVRKPDLSRLMDEPDKKTTLAEDVGSRPQREGRRPGRKARAEELGEAEEPEPGEPPPAAPPPASPPPPPPSRPAAETPASETGAAETGAAETGAAETGAAAGDGFIVQDFATHDEEQAKKVRGQVEAEGYTAFISAVDQPQGKYYRVRIGPFAERERAERAARGVKKKFKLETWVTAATN